MDVVKGLFDVVMDRKENPSENSYTCYLFDKGLDKILKKCGEENAEMIIAAKNNDKEELKQEFCDLLYHMMVLLAEKEITMDEIYEILEQRRAKIGNLKVFHQTDKES